MNIEQSALVSSYCVFVQEQIAHRGRSLIDPQNFRAKGGLGGHLVLILQVRKLRGRDLYLASVPPCISLGHRSPHRGLGMGPSVQLLFPDTTALALGPPTLPRQEPADPPRSSSWGVQGSCVQSVLAPPALCTSRPQEEFSWHLFSGITPGYSE